jgi:hypothetical protein
MRQSGQIRMMLGHKPIRMDILDFSQLPDRHGNRQVLLPF